MVILNKGILKKDGVEFAIELVRTGTGYFYKMTHGERCISQNTCPSVTAIGCTDSLEFYRHHGWEIEAVEITRVSVLEQQQFWELLDQKNLFLDLDACWNGDGFVSLYTNNKAVVVEKEKFVEAIGSLIGVKPSIYEFWLALGHKLNIEIEEG